MSERNGSAEQSEGTSQTFLARLLQSFVGQPCVAWRKGYGRTGSLHFGTLVPARVQRPKLVNKDRGMLILNLWDCDRTLQVPGNSVIDSTREGDEALLTRLASLEGAQVTDVLLDPPTLSLTLIFSTGARLALVTDSRSGREDEQWAIEALNQPSISVFGTGHLVVEDLSSRWD